ncbi:MAG: PQQ-binding-like beta-propeller repeat protein [Gemmatimonadetes bacterium]|nr:PQQ-binding-like beta-propeller repeat protein [Gemmatimonadota bacterium]
MGQMGHADASTTRWDALTYDGSAPGRNVPSLHVYIRPKRLEGRAPDEARRLFQDVISRYYSGPPFLTPEEKMRDLLVTAIPANARTSSLQIGIAICNRAESAVHLFRQGGAEAWLGNRLVEITEGRVRFLREPCFAFIDGLLDEEIKNRLTGAGPGRLLDDGRTAGLAFVLNPDGETNTPPSAADIPEAPVENELPLFQDAPATPAETPELDSAPYETPKPDDAPYETPEPEPAADAHPSPMKESTLREARAIDASFPSRASSGTPPENALDATIADRIAAEVLAPKNTGAERIAFPLLPVSLVVLVALVALFWRQPGKWEDRAGQGEVPPAATISQTSETAQSTAEPGIDPAADAPPALSEPDAFGPGDLVWTFNAGAAITSSPAAADGALLVGSRDGNLYAIDPATGAELWRAPGPQGVGSSPAYGGGRAYYADYGGDVVAVDLETGAEIWRRGTGSKIVSSPLYDGERVYVGSFNRSLYALSSETGEIIWRYRTDDAIWSSPRLAGDLVLIGSIDRNLHAVRREDGKREWKAPTGGPLYASPTVENDRIFVGSRDGFFYCLSLDDGSRVWRTEVGSAIHSSAALGDDRLFVGTEDGAFISLSQATGELLWSFPTGGRLPASPRLHEGVVYAPSYDQYAYALDAESGHPVWRINVGSSAYSSPAVQGGRLYFGTNDGRLVAYAVGESP